MWEPFHGTLYHESILTLTLIPDGYTDDGQSAYGWQIVTRLVQNKTKVAPPTGKPSNPDVDPIPTQQAQLQIPSHAILQRHCEPEAMSETSSAGPSQLCGGGIPGPGTTHFLHGNPSVSMNTVTPNPNTHLRMVTQGYFTKFNCFICSFTSV